ncbi:MAG: hypothetical protein OHK0012_00760 [Synechococcales cyanobacterium]
MKRCPHCGASNPNSQQVCRDCGGDLSAIGSSPSLPSPPLAGSVPLTSLPELETVQSAPRPFSKLDVMLVLPVGLARDPLATELAHLLHQQSLRLGVIGYGGRGEALQRWTFAGEVFCRDPHRWQAEWQGHLPAPAVGETSDAVVRSGDALGQALVQPFRAPRRAIVLVAVQPPLFPDEHMASLEHVIQRLRQSHVDRLYVVTRIRDPLCQGYLRLLEGSRGIVLDGASPTREWIQVLLPMLTALAQDDETQTR